MNARPTLTFLALLALAAPAAHADLVLPRPSPKATVMQSVGITDFTIAYSRPGVKKRTIWGDLVPWDKPWRTGANEATAFTTTDTIMVAGQKLPAGSYSIVTIPTQKGWTVIFNKDLKLWAVNPYAEAQDALRVPVTPSTGNPHVEWLEFSFDNLTPTSCDLVMSWETLKLTVPITVDVNAKVLASARAEVKDWRTPYRAASWAFDSGVALNEAAGWLDESIMIQKAYSNQALKARWLAKDGKKTEAIAMAKSAIAAGKAATPPADVAPTEKLLAEWTAAK